MEAATARGEAPREAHGALVQWRVRPRPSARMQPLQALGAGGSPRQVAEGLLPGAERDNHVEKPSVRSVGANAVIPAWAANSCEHCAGRGHLEETLPVVVRGRATDGHARTHRVPCDWCVAEAEAELAGCSKPAAPNRLKG